MSEEQIKKLIADAIEADRKKQENPYYVGMQYLVGISSLALALIVAFLTALVSGHAFDAGSSVAKMLAWTLAWVTVALYVAILGLSLYQIARARKGRDRAWVFVAAVLVAGISLPVVSFALRGSAAMLMPPAATGAAVELPSFIDAVSFLKHHSF